MDLGAEIPKKNKRLCALYLILALAAGLACWSQNWAYVGDGPVAGTTRFFTDTLTNPASRSITFDLSFMFVVCSFWMVSEARRLELPYVWIYVVLGLLIAISVTFPLFLIHREIKMAQSSP